MQTGITGSIGQHGTSQQWTERIEATAWIANHPAVAETARIQGLALLLHRQHNGRELIATGSQGVAMTSLQHEKGVLSVLKPSPWVRGLIKLHAIHQALTSGLSKFNQHRQDSSAIDNVRSENPQINNRVTVTRVNHSGTTRVGQTKETKSLRPIKATAK